MAQGAAGLGRLGIGLSGWLGGAWLGGLAWVVRRRLGMGGRGRCRAWAGSGASVGWTVRFVMR